MVLYQERQIGWAMVLFGTILPVFLVLAYAFQWGSNPLPLLALWILLPVFLCIFLIFSTMTTHLYADRIEVRYGFGVIRRVFLLGDCAEVSVEKIPWWVGAGIRYAGQRTLYSINFTDAVAFRLRGSNRQVAIGSRNPAALCDAIVGVLTRNNEGV